MRIARPAAATSCRWSRTRPSPQFRKRPSFSASKPPPACTSRHYRVSPRLTIGQTNRGGSSVVVTRCPVWPIRAKFVPHARTYVPSHALPRDHEVSPGAWFIGARSGGPHCPGPLARTYARATPSSAITRSALGPRFIAAARSERLDRSLARTRARCERAPTPQTTARVRGLLGPLRNGATKARKPACAREPASALMIDGVGSRACPEACSHVGFALISWELSRFVL